MKTKVIGLLGAPGSGKSTQAAHLYAQLSQQGKSVELVREFVKESYAWPGRLVNPFNQIHAIATQIQRESSLFGKVETIVTDSPVILGLFYLEHSHSVPWFREFVEGYHVLCQQYSVRQEYYYMDLSVPYRQEGRYQNEDESKEINANLLLFLKNNKINYKPYSYLEI